LFNGINAEQGALIQQLQAGGVIDGKLHGKSLGYQKSEAQTGIPFLHGAKGEGIKTAVDATEPVGFG
jgi:hypothetical protein